CCSRRAKIGQHFIERFDSRSSCLDQPSMVTGYCALVRDFSASAAAAKLTINKIVPGNLTYRTQQNIPSTYGDNHHLSAHRAERVIFNGRNVSGIGSKAAASAVGRRRKRRRAGGARSRGKAGVLPVNHSTGHDADRHPDWSVGGGSAGRTSRIVLERDSKPRTVRTA